MVRMPHWPKPIGLLQNETSLERMQEVLARLGNPHQKLPPTIHIAGTNGKGSTLAFIQAMLEAAGKKVHKYTTPHLVDFNERITLAGKEIEDEDLFEIMERVRLASEGLRLGFYEATTAGAFLAFSERPADFLLLETGLGGRLDATNIIESPIITIISTISLDHMDFLGVTVRLIAGEKTHIVKKGSVCILSLQHQEAFEVIESWCASKQIDLKAFGADFSIEKTTDGFVYLSPAKNYNFPQPNLLGEHQLINAASAITACLQIGIDESAIEAGLKNAKWPSRLEKIKYENFEFWLDGAHNPSGAFVIANFIKEEFKDKPVYIIFGTTRGRNVANFLKHFRDNATEIALVKIRSEPNSYDPEEMLQQMEQTHNIKCYDDIADALKLFATKGDGVTICLGSLFMRGDIIQKPL